MNEAIQSIPAFLKLGIPGMFQTCFEWWATDVITVLCGILPRGESEVAIGASFINDNIYNVPYFLYFGLATACNVRVGNTLGTGDPRTARLASTVSIFTAEILAAVNSILLFAYVKIIPTFFTLDKALDRATSRLLIIVAIAQLPAATNVTVQGILRGQGQQHLGAKIQFFGYYMIGIPLGAHLAFHMGYGAVGLWCGFLVSLPIMAIIGVIVITKSDWKILSKQARDRSL